MTTVAVWQGWSTFATCLFAHFDRFCLLSCDVSCSNSSASLWLYWVAPMFAALIGAFFFLIMVPSEFSKDIPSFVQVVLQDWHVSKYFSEFICTWFLTMSAVLGNGGATAAACVTGMPHQHASVTLS